MCPERRRITAVLIAVSTVRASPLAVEFPLSNARVRQKSDLNRLRRVAVTHVNCWHRDRLSLLFFTLVFLHIEYAALSLRDCASLAPHW